MILAVVVRAVQMSGGSLLNAYDLVICQVVYARDIRTFFYDNNLYAGCVRICKVYILLSVLCGGHTCQSHINLTGLDSGNQSAELHIDHLHLQSQLLCQSLRDVSVDTYDIISVLVLIGRKCGVGSYSQNAVRNGGKRSVCLSLCCLFLLGSAGCHGNAHNSCQ